MLSCAKRRHTQYSCPDLEKRKVKQQAEIKLFSMLSCAKRRHTQYSCPGLEKLQCSRGRQQFDLADKTSLTLSQTKRGSVNKVVLNLEDIKIGHVEDYNVFGPHE